MTFETKRIKLRKMIESDIVLYNQWSNDTDVTQNTYPNLDCFTLDDTKKFYEKVSQSKTFIIESLEENQAIGITSFIGHDEFNHHAEFIIDIGDKKSWGKGYGKEAVLLMLKYGFEELNFHRLQLRVFSFNERAINLYKTLGFLEEGRSREALFRFGKWHDVVMMGMLQNEYFAQVTPSEDT